MWKGLLFVSILVLLLKFTPAPEDNRAFSLVELSIVLVILGLLTGGILAGQSLIRAAELRSISTQYQTFTTAIQAFRDKYFAAPGDMTNAISFWGAAHATPATCETTAGTGIQTCNGNGDGRILPNSSSNESFRFWQHLANAGLIEGTYNGITQGSTNYSATAVNSPTSKFRDALWFIWHWGPISANGEFFDNDYGSSLELGAAVSNADPSTGILLPEEMWNIDTKLDDGKPGTGKLTVRCTTGFSNCTTTSSSSALNADYLLSGTSRTCAMIFKKAL